jgi:hypothetical protein
VIVISGALVLVALVLLVIGIALPELDYVYASIVVSLISFGFLLIGILQRRGDKAPAGAPVSEGRDTAADRGEVEDGVTAVVPRRPARERVAGAGQSGSRRIDAEVEEPVREEPHDDEADEVDDLEEPARSGTVLVVPGRPRYHVAGCRYLTGKSASDVDVQDARDEGFTPCGVCKPDDTLAAGSGPEPVAATAPLRRSRSTSTPRKAPVRRSPRAAAATTQPSPAAEAAAADPATDPVLAAVADETPAVDTAPAQDSAPALDSTPAAAAAGPDAAARRKSGTVVVIPDRGKYHRAECRYVRNAEGASTLTKTQATKKGYDACGVCKP